MLILRMRMAFMYAYIFFVVSVFILFTSLFCGGSDTISAGESLFSNQTIISKEGKFELGFFSPALSNSSSSYYVGIWYKNIPVRTVVWVLNRNRPIPYSHYNNSQLQISNGTLLLRSGLEIFWEYAYNGTLNATEAVILDTGNFVLRNAPGVLWESFEHPTDTWLPGGKLEYHWYADAKGKLVSWRNADDPASGTFSLLGGNELSINANGRQTVWSSGPWRGGTFLSLFNNSDLSNSYNFTYLSRGSNLYLTYNIYNESVLSRIVIDYLGRMTLYGWSEARQAWVVLMARPSSCSAYALCGLNTICNINYSTACSCFSRFQPQVQREWDSSDFSKGCTRMKSLQCAEKVGYMKVTAHRLPANPVADLPSSACKLFCSNSCSCNAYAYSIGGGCLLFMGDLLPLDSPPNNSEKVHLYVKMKSKGKRRVLLLALVVPIATAVLLSCFGFCYLRRKLKSTKSRETHQNLLLLDLNSHAPAYKKGAQAWNMWIQERALELVDPVMEIPASSLSIPLRYIKIGLLCVQENPADRPLMSDVVVMLDNEDAEMAAPLNPAFTVIRTSAKPHRVEVEMCSMNGLTLSHVEAR
ncbi:hypothetical protein C2S52_013577 [Perilla frutescens var. hirtella]|nr:hypothetical protein C2S52_013577 [Perilla frutescens var. hirtella]